ncbi:MAG TPA: hypothetical protein VFP25_06605, partial [Nitrososphaeraceae archaeon]|nr:hypothetical protein [Nitrososphaeraceae archaeon]
STKKATTPAKKASTKKATTPAKKASTKKATTPAKKASTKESDKVNISPENVTSQQIQSETTEP